MGARQVPRAAGQVALGAALACALLVGARAAAAAPTGPVVLLDARDDAAAHADARAALARALAADGVAIVTLDLTPPPIDLAALALDDAAARFGDLDCAGASAAAGRAIGELARRQLTGGDATAALRRAWTYRYLCGERVAAHPTMQRAAAALRTLGVVDGPTVGIAPASWASTPALDASTDRDIVALQLGAVLADGEAAIGLPADAEVWLDHAPLPAGAGGGWFAPAGEHVVAVRATIGGVVRTGAVVDALVDPTHRQIAVALTPVDVEPAATPALASARAALEVARASGSTSDERRAAVLAAMTATAAPQAVLLRSATSAEIWRRAADGVGLAKHATVPLAASRIVAALTAAPVAEAPLLDDKTAPRYGQKASTTRWWVYASLAGAIALSTTVLLVAGSGDDVQRIEVRGP